MARSPRFQLRKLRHPTAMTPSSAEARRQERLHQVPGQPVANHQRAEADEIKVVVFHSLMGGEGFMNQTSPHASDLFGGSASSHPASTDGDPAGDCTTQGDKKIRIIVVRLQLSVVESITA